MVFIYNEQISLNFGHKLTQSCSESEGKGGKSPQKVSLDKAILIKYLFYSKLHCKYYLNKYN